MHTKAGLQRIYYLLIENEDVKSELSIDNGLINGLKLRTSRGANSWIGLDHAIYAIHEFILSQSLDDICSGARFTISKLASDQKRQKERTKNTLKNINSKILRRKFINFNSCKFCWRNVPTYNNSRKNLCDLHNLPSTHQAYRKSYRLYKSISYGKLRAEAGILRRFMIKDLRTKGIVTDTSDTVRQYSTLTFKELIDVIPRSTIKSEQILCYTPSLFDRLISLDIDTSSAADIIRYIDPPSIKDDAIASEIRSLNHQL